MYGRDMLKHSTAQHSTAQHSTAQHSTAQVISALKIDVIIKNSTFPLVKLENTLNNSSKII